MIIAMIHSKVMPTAATTTAMAQLGKPASVDSIGRGNTALDEFPACNHYYYYYHL